MFTTGQPESGRLPSLGAKSCARYRWIFGKSYLDREQVHVADQPGGLGLRHNRKSRKHFDEYRASIVWLDQGC